MRRILGAVIFLIGLLGLGFWATFYNAPYIEAKIAVRAANNFAVLDATHDVVTSVSGRDIRVTGLANSAAEKEIILRDLDRIPGRRTVVDEINVLAHISPYVFSARKSAFNTSYDGLVPTENTRTILSYQIGTESAQMLELAAGAPDAAWPGVLKLSLGALDALLIGEFILQDRDLVLTGLAKTPADKIHVETILLSVPFDYTVKADIDIHIDDRPADFELFYSVYDGVTIDGRVPAGLDKNNIAKVLNISGEVAGDTKESILGDSDLAQSHLRLLSHWLPELENARLKIAPNVLEFEVTVSPGLDPHQIETVLASALFPDTKIIVHTPSKTPSVGDVRLNAATAGIEFFKAGYWLPVMSFEPTQDVCKTMARETLAKQKVSFVAGSDQLHVQSTRALNTIAAILHKCKAVSGLKIEIDSFVERPGNTTYNEGLRRDRAIALRMALMDRGIADRDISPQGIQSGRIVVATKGQKNSSSYTNKNTNPSIPKQMEKATEGR